MVVAAVVVAIVVVAVVIAVQRLCRALGASLLQIFGDRQVRRTAELLRHHVIQYRPHGRVAKRVVKPHTVGLPYGATSEPIPAHERAEDGAEIGAHWRGRRAVKQDGGENETDDRRYPQDDLLVQRKLS